MAASEVADDLVRMARYVADASPLPILATIRTSVEGGEASLDDEEYCALVAALAPHVGGVDVEIRRDGSSALIEDAHAAGALVIGSFHDFEGTPSDDQLAEVLADMNYAGADVLKFACMAHSATDAARVLGAQAWAREAYDRPVIGIAMGPNGAPTRLVGSALGSAATFATLPGAGGWPPAPHTIPPPGAAPHMAGGPAPYTHVWGAGLVARPPQLCQRHARNAHASLGVTVTTVSEIPTGPGAAGVISPNFFLFVTTIGVMVS